MVYRRYRDFYKLLIDLARAGPIPSAAFPRKHFTGCTGTKLERRRAMLEFWLMSVVPISPAVNNWDKPLREFLEFGRHQPSPRVTATPGPETATETSEEGANSSSTEPWWNSSRLSGPQGGYRGPHPLQLPTPGTTVVDGVAYADSAGPGATGGAASAVAPAASGGHIHTDAHTGPSAEELRRIRLARFVVQAPALVSPPPPMTTTSDPVVQGKLNWSTVANCYTVSHWLSLPTLPFEVEIPEGIQAGQVIHVITPAGCQADLRVPDGAVPGSSILLTLDALSWTINGTLSALDRAPTDGPSAAGSAGDGAGGQTVDVQLPAGIAAGQLLGVLVPDGRQINFTVPSGTAEGSSLQLWFDPSTGTLMSMQ